MTNIIEMRPQQMPMESVDELRETAITLSCYRETHRLERLLRVYQKALTRAVSEERDGDLIALLQRLHDHKGLLTVWWMKMPDSVLMACVSAAWGSENENQIEHRLVDGEVFWEEG